MNFKLLKIKQETDANEIKFITPTSDRKSRRMFVTNKWGFKIGN